jgi:hypothetical protein
MLIIPDRSDTQSGCQTHPWWRTEYSECGGAYYDFKTQPDLIVVVLEDFRPHARFEAVQQFYEFLRWVNTSPQSCLETNDCALRASHEHGDKIFAFPLKVDGRLHIFFRDYRNNVNHDCFIWLERMFWLYLQVYEPNFRRGLISVVTCETDYVDPAPDKSRGKLLSLSFAAYGDSETDAFDSLLVVFNGLWEASKRNSASVQNQLIDFP